MIAAEVVTVHGHSSEHQGNHNGGGLPDLDWVVEEAFWEERYRSSGGLWSGRPNAQLVAEAAGLTPGRALDAGCGEGGDATWLAERGWAVTAVDISTVALARAATRAAEISPDVARRIDWRHADLTSWMPDGPYDLVSMHFMQAPPGVREPLFRRMAGAVAPAGTLLIVGHHLSHQVATISEHHPALFFTGTDVVSVLDPERWRVVLDTAPGRDITGPGGQPVRTRNIVVRAERRASAPD
jgi:SAM-dependent methyltransferase